MSGSGEERVQGRLDHVEHHLKGRGGWNRGTVKDWMPKPEVEPLPDMAEPLECGQSRALLAQRQRNRSHTALVETPPQSSFPLDDLPIIPEAHDPALPAAAATQHLLIQQSEESSMASSSSPRSRRGTRSEERRVGKECPV